MKTKIQVPDGYKITRWRSKVWFVGANHKVSVQTSTGQWETVGHYRFKKDALKACEKGY